MSSLSKQKKCRTRHSVIKYDASNGQVETSISSGGPSETVDSGMDASKDEVAASMLLLHKRQGSFFAYAFIPMMFFGVCDVCNHLSVYLQTKDWYRNAVAVAFGYVDPKEHETATTSLVIDIHALLGVSVVLLLVAQVSSGIRRHCRSTDAIAWWVKPLHKLLGRIGVVIWTITALFGFAFTFASKRRQQDELLAQIFGNFVLSSVGFGTLFNMFLGIMAVTGKNKEKTDKVVQSTNRMRHKGLMFFSLFYVLGSAFDECLMSAAQAVVNDCFIDFFQGFAAIGQAMQLSCLIIGMQCYEKTLFRYRFVKINLICLVVRAILIWVSVAYILLSGLISTKDNEDSCFA